MKDLIIIDEHVRQLKGALHLHTDRSPDCTRDYHLVLEEYRSKGFDFCLVTDHEVYWDSTECDRDDFLVLSGVENAFLPNPDHLWTLDAKTKKNMHFNLINDITIENHDRFKHGQIMVRPVDYGIDSWNAAIESYTAQGNLGIMNHPDWSRLKPEMMMAVNGVFAFEVYNNASIMSVGGKSDEAAWDYCLEKGRRYRAVATDDAHLYGPEHTECGGGFTMVLSDDFSKEGIVRALKNGDFYASSGPRILDMRIEDGILRLRTTPVRSIRIIGYNAWGKGFTPANGVVDHIEWPIKTELNYFRVQLFGTDGSMAWSQPIFFDDWN
jgi:hypothetical protein